MGKEELILFILILSQSLYEEAAAAERSEGDAEELCCLPQTQELAVVAAVHQGTVITFMALFQFILFCFDFVFLLVGRLKQKAVMVKIRK